MAEAHSLIVAVEDSGTATVVAAEAARVALTTGATTLILVHVLDPRAIPSAAVALSGYYIPIAETVEEGEVLLNLAEKVIHAECAAMGKAPPAIEHAVLEGNPGAALERILNERGASGIVLGARRPHVFGRLSHPNVRSHLVGRTNTRVHIASLQAVDE